ncbi:MAG: hypothetical protein JWM80_2794 [Cyanobacteria bacterium RYN_339]|nr:hypothetical protein [Cyanobacteria bacterium RYN_339]
MLKPQDVVVLLHLAGERTTWTYQHLSLDLGMSASEVHQALRRAGESGLYNPLTKSVRTEALLEFLRYGLRYVYPAKRLPSGRGVPTGISAEPLRQHFPPSVGDELVWPDPAGDAFGDGLEPLYKSVPFAARHHPALHRRLALVDAIRGGRARERKLAMDLLPEELRS